MTYENYNFLKIERKDNGILLITMNRPEVLNACEESGHAELGRIWQDFDRDPLAKVAVITGAGKGFCAGGDMRQETTIDAQPDLFRIWIHDAADRGLCRVQRLEHDASQRSEERSTVRAG